MGRVLLVDDSIDCQMLVSRALHGCVDLQIAPALAEARRLIASRDFQLVLLDVDLPDGNGFALCSSLISDTDLRRPRVIFLTGSRDIAQKLTGFSVGGDDYVTKPFDPLELKARVTAHLRAHAELTRAGETLRSGNLLLNLAAFSAEVQGPEGFIRLELTPTEYRLLYALVRNEGRILTREQLLSNLLGHGEDVVDRTIDAHLSKLRKKLAQCTHGIEGVYGIGYRWVRVRPE